MRTDPVCHIPPPKPQILPNLKNIPAVVPATDLRSAIAAVNTLRTIIQIITGQSGVNGQNGASGAPGGGGAGGGAGGGGGSGGGKDKDKKAQWKEESRVTEKVRVYNPHDKTQYVDVERINQLVMVDSNSKQKWTWRRQR